MIRRLAPSVFAVLLAFVASSHAHPRPVTVIRAGTLIDPHGARALTNQLIVVEGDTITAVGAGLVIPAGATVIDLSNEVVLPALIDADVHMLVLVVVLAIAMRDRGGTQPNLGTPPNLGSKPTLTPQELPSAGRIEVRYPPNLTSKSGHDWEKVIEKVYENEFGGALRELDKWERKYGEREETSYLRAQLERLPPELLGESN